MFCDSKVVRTAATSRSRSHKSVALILRLEAGFAAKSTAWVLEIQVEFDFVGKMADSTPWVNNFMLAVAWRCLKGYAN
jgi:hypothetical protein